MRWLLVILKLLFGPKVDLRVMDTLERRLTECDEDRIRLRTSMDGLGQEVRILAGTVRRIEYRHTSGLIVCDQRGVIVEWNPGATILLKWTSAEAVGKSVAVLIPPENRQRHATAYFRLAKDKLPPDPKPTVRMALTHEGERVAIVVRLSSWTTDEQVYYAAEIRPLGHEEMEVDVNDISGFIANCSNSEWLKHHLLQVQERLAAIGSTPAPAPVPKPPGVSDSQPVATLNTTGK